MMIGKTLRATGRIGRFTYEFDGRTLWLENTRNGWTGSYQGFEADVDADATPAEEAAIHKLADRLGAD